jgi:hypothetical protein
VTARLTAVVFALVVAGCGGTGMLARWVYPHDFHETNVGTSNSVACDKDGYIYAAGTLDDKLAVICFAPDGTIQWKFLYNDPGITLGHATSIVCGRDTTVYVAGISTDAATADLPTVICLRSTDGYMWWNYRYSTDEGSATALVYGDDGNLYVSGTLAVAGGGGSTWFFAMSLAGGKTGGSYRWEYRYQEHQWYDRAMSISYGAGGNIYVGGGVLLWPENRCAFTVASLNTLGIPNWSEPFRYCGPNNGTYNLAHSLTCDAQGNVYAAGYCDGGGWQGDFTVISIAPDKTMRWTYRYPNPEVTGSDLALSVVCGSNNDVYAAGHITHQSTGQDFAVLSLTSDLGGYRWLNCYTREGNMYDRANAVACGDDDCVYAAGYMSYASSQWDLAVVKATCATGGRVWTYSFDGPTCKFDGANAVATSAGGHVYVVGQTEFSGVGLGTFTVAALESF